MISPRHDSAPTKLRESVPTEYVASLGFDGVPKAAARYVRSRLHVVKRSDGETGYQFVNDLAPGASLAAIDVVKANGKTKGYVILTEQQRYPHPQPGYEHLNLEEAARVGKIGRVGLELPSGGIEGSETPVQAAIREAREEAGIINLDEGQLVPLILGAKAAISINNQEFNIFAAKLQEGQWDPSLVEPDVEEGEIRTAAYRLDTAVPELMQRGHIWDLSTITAINSLWRIKEFRKYL